MQLTQQEINERMIELRNLRKLHGAARERIVFLETENKTLKARVKELEKENTVLRGEVSDIRYQLEEFKTIIFKKKRIARDVLDDDDEETPPRPPRDASSYQRPIPKDTEITKTVYHRFPRDKNGDVRLRTYYVEDIPLNVRKIVEKHVVEQWYDKGRRVWVSRDPLPNATVTLGDNARVLITTLITVQRLSLAQTQRLLATLFNLSISDGEIVNILDREAHCLTPAAHAQLVAIQAETSHHMDESRYDVNGEARYAWSMTGGESGDTVYRLGVSRGKGIAEDLRGDSDGILISDDYGAYRILAEHHQLCFAHLIRKFRDLAHHDGFTDAQKEAIRATYGEIKAIYRAVVFATTGNDPPAYHQALTERFQTVSTITGTDPKPVVRLKTTLRKNIDTYLTCLFFPTIALTNNTAERALRHVVLKRKISFGCKSEKGAKTLGILLSVLLTLYRNNPLSYFERYGELRRV
jgi:hypothetical protein